MTDDHVRDRGRDPRPSNRRRDPRRERDRAGHRGARRAARACCWRRATSTPGATRAGTWASSTRRSCSTARGRDFRVEALNARGRVLLAADRRGAPRARNTVERVSSAEDVRSRARCGARGPLRRGGAQPPAVGVLALAGARRALPPRGRAAPRPLRRLRLRPRVPVRADPAPPRAPARPARPRPLPARRADHRRPPARGRDARGATTSRSAGRSTAGLPRRRRHGAVRRRPRAARARGDHAPGRVRGHGARGARVVPRGDLFEVVPGQTFCDGVPAAAVGALPAAARAQPVALRLPHQPRRGGVPRRRLARDVRARRRRPRGDLPDLGHDRPRAATRSGTPPRSWRCSPRARTSPS